MHKRSSDVIVIGGGIIGLSLALELRRRGFSVRVLERGEPGREASWAGAGMLAYRDPETPESLRNLMNASAQMYPDWVDWIERESGLKADFRRKGTLYLVSAKKEGLGAPLSAERMKKIEPEVVAVKHCYLTEEGSVDPRALLAAIIEAAKKNGALISHEHSVTSLDSSDGVVSGVRCGNKSSTAGVVVNCAGAWAGEIDQAVIPSLPVKGQMLSVVNPHGERRLLKHVVRGDDVYLVPRSDGRILIGATVEHVGFDKAVVPETILKMRDLATQLVPEIGRMHIHESWAGLRPGSPDKLPILGETNIKNYFVATGHYRNGILLAPITARVIADLIEKSESEFELSAFSFSRFSAQ